MRASKSIQMLISVFQPETGPAGIGVMAADLPPTAISSVREAAFGGREYLYFRAILHAFTIAGKLGADRLSILCPDERIVRLVNREIPLELGVGLAPMYMEVRGRVHAFRAAEIRAVSRFRVAPARRLAVSACRTSMSRLSLLP